MRIRISLEAESDLADGFWFYENRLPGLGNQFRSSLKSDIRSLKIHGGSHPLQHGYHKKVCKKFPFSVYYQMDSEESLTVVAVFGQKRGANWIKKRLNGDGE